MSSNRPAILIGGCHRSGTTLVRRILNAHSRIYCGPEVKFFRDFYDDYFYDPLYKIRFAHTARSILPEPELLHVLGAAFVEMHERAAARAGKIRWADKNPENVLYADQWRQILGDHWVFIHVVRNPLDTLASIYDAHFDDVIPLLLEARIAHYKRYTEAGLSIGAEDPARYYEVLYEDLVTQPEKTVSALMAWLDEPFEAAQLDFGKVQHQTGLEDPNVEQTEGIHRESLQRWARVLTRQEAFAVYAACVEQWRLIDPAEKWIVNPAGAPPLPANSSISDRTPAPGPGDAAIDRAGPEVGPDLQARDHFELLQTLASTQQWANQLLEIIAARDRELARLKGFLPYRMARMVKQALPPRNGRR